MGNESLRSRRRARADSSPLAHRVVWSRRRPGLEVCLCASEQEGRDAEVRILRRGIAHTPEQTGGFSEDNLTNAFYNATIPDGGTFDNTIVQYCVWHQAHLWRDIDTPEKQTGMRAYLRSLTPQGRPAASSSSS